MFCQGDNKKRRFKWLLDPTNIFFGPTYYEDIYLHAYETMSEVRRALTSYFSFYNVDRPHQSLEYRTPDEMYFATDTIKQAA